MRQQVEEHEVVDVWRTNSRSRGSALILEGI